MTTVDERPVEPLTLADLADVYDLHGGTAFRLAFRLTRDRGLAEDVVQEAFLSLWQARESYRPEVGAIRPWLLTLVHRRAVDLIRHRQAQPATWPLDETRDPPYLPDTRPGPEQQACDNDQQERIVNAVRELKPAQQEALLLTYIQGLTQAEAAAVLGIPTAPPKRAS